MGQKTKGGHETMKFDMLVYRFLDNYKITMPVSQQSKAETFELISCFKKNCL